MSADSKWIIDRLAEYGDEPAIIRGGHVTTYGDLCSGAPRFAGMVMSACHDPTVPWQRIVRADGSLAKGDRQRRLLQAEGVPFRGARVDMRVAWADVESLID